MQEKKTDYNAGTLYICPTPIGNLEDITLRCLRILKEVDFIAAEDTRVTKKLLNFYNIQTPLISYHKFSEKKKSLLVIEKLRENYNVALVSDSGTPLISDPGKEVISQAIHNNIPITPLPGPSSLTCALSASNIITDGFLFYGFLPKTYKQKKECLNQLSQINYPIIIFESPKRVLNTLECLKEVYDNCNIIIARELSKIHEEILYFSLDNAINHFTKIEPRGEFTIIIEHLISPTQNHLSIADMKKLIANSLATGNSISSIAKELSQELNISKNELYKLILDIQEEI